MLKTEKDKNQQLEVEMYEEYDKKLVEMKEYIVDKVDQFLQYKGSEIYEQAKKDLVNDPRILEHKVALDKIVNITSDYLSDEDKSFATASKIEEASKAIEELRGQLRIMEARNIRLSTDNTRLTESVRRVSHNVITEAAKPAAAAAKKTKVLTEQKERTLKVKNASGRGHVDTENVQVIAEFNDNSNGAVNDLLVLSGVKKSKN